MNPVSLRPYQIDAIARVRAEIGAGHRRVVLVSPTGSGKTCITAEISRMTLARGGYVLFVAHRRELIEQTYTKMLEVGIDPASIGVIMAGDKRYRPNARLQIASVDTLRNRAKPKADVVIFDESHRSLSPTILALVEEHYPAAVILGPTATPSRGDGRSLGELYTAMVVVTTPRRLISDGYLVEPRVYTVPPDALPDLSKVKTSGGDYDETELRAAVDTGVLIGSIVEHWQRLAGNRRTVVFAAGVEHSKHIAQRFVAAGIAAEHLDGETPAEERDAILARLRAGVTRVVSSCGVLCEGWDCPPVKCAVLARPTKSEGLYIQMAGRILRPWTDVDGSRPDALILDHAGNAVAHGLPQETRVFSLTAPKRSANGANMCPTRTCPSCFAVLAAATTLCTCGHVFEREERAAPVEREGELVLADERASAREAVRKQVAKLVGRVAREMGFEYQDVNKAIVRRFKKSRGDQTTAELQAVVAWIESGELTKALNLLNPPKPAVSLADATPKIEAPWLSDEETVEVTF